MNEIKPKGWIYSQLNNDLVEGYVGSFDRVNNTVAKDVFVNQDRLSKRSLGFRKEWWSGEHEGYWKDAVVRTAFLTENSEYIKKSGKWMNEIMEATNENGYIGIYKDCDKPGCRFNHDRGNGELWVTSRILMAMLAYYEYTGEDKVLESAEKAAGLIMNKYSDRNYFDKYSRGGGIGHGVGFFENLEWLYRITGKPEYLEFAKKLYRDFNAGDIRDDDLKTSKLLEEDQLFVKHGAHIAEGLFVPEFISTINEDPVFDEAAENVIKKLEAHITPGGAMRADEWVKERRGSADERYEYCGITEMISPLNKIIAFSGDISQADKIETMTFNAGQGARFPTLKALSYLTTDNRLKINHRELILRETYDASHFAAACCVLSGARLMPYYVEGMWMKKMDEEGLLALLFGPSELNTSIKGIPVRVEEITDYPFRDEIEFVITPDHPVEFPLEIRKSFGCSDFDISIPDNARMEELSDRIIIRHTWEKGDRVNLVFNFQVEKIDQPASKTVKEGGVYFRRGPIVFALPFAHKLRKTKEYNESGFYRYRITPENKQNFNLRYVKNTPVEFKRSTENNKEDIPWKTPGIFLRVQLKHKKEGVNTYDLVPMGHTILRRVSFSISDNN